METSKTSRPLVAALVVFLVIVVLGESVALLLEYQNSSYLQQYVSQNGTTVLVEILVVAILALGSFLLVYRRGQAPRTGQPSKADLPLKSDRPLKVELQGGSPVPRPFAQNWNLPVESGRITILSDTSHLFMRSLKKLMRNPILLFFSLFQPIIFLVLFTQLFSKFPLAGTGAATYLAFAAPGIVLQNGFSSAFQSGTAVVDDLRSGFLGKMLATPVSRSAILLGRILTDMFRVVVQSSIILVLAYALGASATTGVPGYLLMLVTIAFFALAWSGIALSLGLKTRNAETVFGIAAFLTFPLLFMSTALVPAISMPDWMNKTSTYNPISITVNALRPLMISGYDWGAIATAFGVIGLLGMLTMGATLYLFRKVVS